MYRNILVLILIALASASCDHYYRAITVVKNKSNSDITVINTTGEIQCGVMIYGKGYEMDSLIVPKNTDYIICSAHELGYWASAKNSLNDSIRQVYFDSILVIKGNDNILIHPVYKRFRKKTKLIVK